MAAIPKHVSVSLLFIALGCVDVPKAPSDFSAEGPDTDTAAGAQLATDGGWWVRPDIGEPYLGPECDPSSSGRGGAAHAAAGSDADFALPDAGPRADLGAGAGSMAGMPVEMARRPSAAGQLVITELLSNPESVRDDAGEWFELHNAGVEAFDLGGCAIDDGGSSPRLVEGPLRVEPDAFVAVARSLEVGFTPDFTLSFSLGNAADVLALICDGIVIDRVAYGAGFPLAPGASMALDPGALDASVNDAPEVWCVGLITYGAERGSPGAPNPSCSEIDAGTE
jgi:hypothetical protein